MSHYAPCHIWDILGCLQEHNLRDILQVQHELANISKSGATSHLDFLAPTSSGVKVQPYLCAQPVHYAAS